VGRQEARCSDQQWLMATTALCLTGSYTVASGTVLVGVAFLPSWSATGSRRWARVLRVAPSWTNQRPSGEDGLFRSPTSWSTTQGAVGGCDPQNEREGRCSGSPFTTLAVSLERQAVRRGLTVGRQHPRRPERARQARQNHVRYGQNLARRRRTEAVLHHRSRHLGRGNDQVLRAHGLGEVHPSGGRVNVQEQVKRLQERPPEMEVMLSSATGATSS